MSKTRFLCSENSSGKRHTKISFVFQSKYQYEKYAKLYGHMPGIVGKFLRDIELYLNGWIGVLYMVENGEHSSQKDTMYSGGEPFRASNDNKQLLWHRFVTTDLACIQRKWRWVYCGKGIK